MDGSLDEDQLLNAWICVLREITRKDRPIPGIYLEYRVNKRPLDVVVIHKRYSVSWLCELKKSSVDLDQAAKTLQIDKETLIRYGFLKDGDDYWFLFVLGDKDRLQPAFEKLRELDNQDNYGLAGLELIHNSISVSCRGDDFEPEPLRELITSSNYTYRRRLPLLIDESVVNCRKPTEKSRNLDIWLLNGALKTIFHSEDGIINWTRVHTELFRNLSWFSYSSVVEKALMERFKRLMKRFTEKEYLKYRTHSKDWSIENFDGLAKALNNKSSLMKTLLKKGSGGQLTLFDSFD